MEAVI